MNDNKRKEPKHNNSNVISTVLRAVIRDEIGRFRIRQCHPKTFTEIATSQYKKDFRRKTVGDILNRLHNNNNMRKIVRGA